MRNVTADCIIRAIKEHEAGGRVDNLCRQFGISSYTIYNWRSEYAGMEANEVKRLRGLESESAKLKKSANGEATRK